jgi:NTP pyrophosphatase (non-canonical NTP hydrolase)
MTLEQFLMISEWQNRTFGQATALSKTNHLIEEVLELRTDLVNNDPNKRMEFADCFILLFGAASSDGMTYADICAAIDEKMQVNYSRKWGKPNENGVVNHIKTGQPDFEIVKDSDGKKYRVSLEPIVPGDNIWCQASKTIDKCIEVFSDNSVVVELTGGARAAFNLSHFKKAKKI